MSILGAPNKRRKLK